MHWKATSLEIKSQLDESVAQVCMRACLHVHPYTYTIFQAEGVLEEFQPALEAHFSRKATIVIQTPN